MLGIFQYCGAVLAGDVLPALLPWPRQTLTRNPFRWR
jgi:hypothetical protein